MHIFQIFVQYLKTKPYLCKRLFILIFIKMRKKLLVTGIALSSFLSMYAGGLLTNTNQNVSFLRNPARGASLEIDAVYTNPAGLAFLNKDGFYLSLNNQSAFQTRTITSTFAPFEMNGGSDTKEFKGAAKALVIPSLQAAYKKGNWVFSGSFAVVGGGGSLVFDKGLPSFEAQAAQLPVLANQMLSGFGGSVTQYSMEQYLKGTSITYGTQLGATYKICDIFSGFVGVRASFVSNSYEGYLRNIQINPNLSAMPALGLNGSMIPASEFINKMVLAGQLTPAQRDEYLKQVADKEVDVKQSGWGIAPILGLNFNWNKLNVGVKYEFITKIEIKNDTKEGMDAGMDAFKNGVKTPYDIPALLTIGAQYDILSCVTVSAGYHHFFDSNAKMANDKQKFINGGVNEYLAGVEYRINKMFLVSAGGQATRFCAKNDYQSDMSFFLNSYTIGLGGAINITENIRVNLAYLFTNYEDLTKKSTAITDVFSRTNKALGIGVDFRF